MNPYLYVQDFKKLRVWHAADNLSDEIYSLTSFFPPTETYGLVVQMRKSAGSICDNIAEGCGRFSRREMIHFLSNAFGSACELESQLSRALRRGFIKDKTVLSRLEDIKRMIAGLAKRLRRTED